MLPNRYSSEYMIDSPSNLFIKQFIFTSLRKFVMYVVNWSAYDMEYGAKGKLMHHEVWKRLCRARATKGI